MKEVKLWFARNKSGEVITIGGSNKNEEYTCALCGSQVIPKALESVRVQPHFAHIDASKCTSEHMIHWWFKNKLLEAGDEFSVKTDKIYTYKVKNICIEKIYNLSGNIIYKPDLTIETETGEIINFELANTNKKKIDDYINIWIELNHIIVEVDIWNIINRENIGIFKALYYEGKVFSDKKTQYQKNIGEYIGYLDRDDEKYNERINNLNWFWKDLCNYKRGLIDIEDLTISLSCIEEDNNYIIKNILKKPSCVNVLDDLNYFKLKKIINQINNKDNLNINFVKSKSNWDNYFDIEYKNHSYSISLSSSENEIKESIENFIKSTEKDIEHTYYLSKAKTNCVLLNVINDFDRIYKLRDENYHFYNRFVYDLYLNLSYHCNTIVDFRIPYYICDCDDEQIISNFFKDNIDFYFDSIEKCINEDKLYNIINKLDTMYKEIYILESKKSRKGIIYYRYRLGLNIRKKKEDLYEIEFYKEDVNEYDDIIKEVEYFKNKVNSISYNQNDLYKLKYQLIKIFNQEIIKLKNEKKIDKIWGKLP